MKKKDLYFQDKVIIITGGSSGIGFALASELGGLGAKIVISGRRQSQLETAALLLKNQGIQVLCVVADAALEADNKRLAEHTIQTFGRIDILINNAGISMRALFEDTQMDVFRQIMDINFFGTVYATKYCLPEIIKHGGTIVGISSIAGYRGLPARTAYSASKAAMQGFLEALRTELLDSGVIVLTVCPGFTASNIRNAALNGMGQPQGESPRDETKMMGAAHVAVCVRKAIVCRHRSLILTGQGKFIIWLNKLLPRFADKLVFAHLAKEKDSPLSGISKP